MNVLDIIKMDCIDLNHEGLGVCKVNGFTIFVEGMLVGEVANIEVTKLTKSFGYGRIIKLLTISKDRVKPICPIFGICGGCDIMHLNYNAQLDFKKRTANETLKRLGKIDFEIKKIVGMENPYYYRNKVQIPFQNKNGKVICGFYKKETHDVVPFEECFIQPSLSTEIAIFICDLANEYKLLAYDEEKHQGILRHILIRNTVDDDYMLVLVTKEEKINNLDKMILRIIEKYPKVKSIIHNINNKKTNVILGDKTKLLFGTLTLIEKQMGFNFILSSKSFFQTNHLQTEKLYSKVLEYASPKKEDIIIDGYCGVGTISLLLSKYVQYVYGIEIVEEAIDDANNNARMNNIKNVEFIIGKTEEEVGKITTPINSIIIDPPRKGCDIKLLNTIISEKIPKIIYVSCNIATLARDLNYLNEYYQTKDITLFDMFPQSSHVETITLLERR